MTQFASQNIADTRTCFTRDLGLIAVSRAEQLMRFAAESRSRNQIVDLLLFMTHPRTIAVGLKDRKLGHPPDLLVSHTRLREEGIAFSRSVRGGGITYHWPGQVVCYPVLALGKGERSIGVYMERLEQVGISTLARFGIKATRNRTSTAHVGLWTGDRKIVSMGVRISRWVTGFGFALNLEGSLAPAKYVRPCGLPGVQLTTMEQVLGTAPPRTWIVDAIRENFEKEFGRMLEPMPNRIFNQLLADEEQTYTTVTSLGE